MNCKKIIAENSAVAGTLRNADVSISCMHTHTHTHSVLTAIFPGEPELASCPLNSPSPFIPGLCILLAQA